MNIMYILTRKSKHFEIDKYPIMIKRVSDNNPNGMWYQKNHS